MKWIEFPASQSTSEQFPIVLADARLSENAAQQTQTEIALMRVRNAEGDLSPHHELMLAARVRPLEA